MAQATDITINDGAATPVAVSFKVVKASPELTRFVDKRLAKPAYWPELTLSSEMPNAKTKVRKPELRVAIPVVDAITGLVTDYGRIRISGDIPMSMSQADINNLWAFAMNGYQHAIIKAAVRDLDVLIG